MHKLRIVPTFVRQHQQQLQRQRCLLSSTTPSFLTQQQQIRSFNTNDSHIYFPETSPSTTEEGKKNGSQQQQEAPKSKFVYSKELARDIVHYIDERTRVRGFSTLKILAGILALSIVAWTLFHDQIKDRLSEHTADVAGRSLTSDTVQVSAQQLSKSVLNDVLADPEMRQAALLFVVDLLQRDETREAAKQLVLQLFNDPTVNTELAKLLVNQWGLLMKDNNARQQVTDMAYYVISQQATMDAMQNQAHNIIQSNDFQTKVNNLFYNSLQSGTVQAGAADLAHAAMNNLLSSEEVNKKVREWAQTVLQDENLQMRGGEAIWGATKWAVLPRWWVGGTRPATDTQPAVQQGIGLASAAAELQKSQTHLPVSASPYLQASADESRELEDTTKAQSPSTQVEPVTTGSA